MNQSQPDIDLLRFDERCWPAAPGMTHRNGLYNPWSTGLAHCFASKGGGVAQVLLLRTTAKEQASATGATDVPPRRSFRVVPRQQTYTRKRRPQAWV
jgi:hypothetical protein